MVVADGGAFEAVAERREDQSVTVAVGAHEKHGPADGREPDGTTGTAQIVKVLRSLFGPAVSVESRPAGLKHAMRMQDIEIVGEEPLEDVLGIIDDVDIEPQHPVLVVERAHQQRVAALRQDDSAA